MKNFTSSPDRKALSGLISGLAFIGGVGAGVASSNAPYPLPGSDADKIRRYFRDNAPSARLSAAGQLISAATLAQFTTSVVRLARRADPASRALPAAAVVGGTAAVASLTNRRMVPGVSDWGACPAPRSGTKRAVGTPAR